MFWLYKYHVRERDNMNFKIGDNFTDSCGYPFSYKIIIVDMIIILERDDNLDF